MPLSTNILVGDPLTPRVALLHTGGWFWVDAAPMAGVTGAEYLQWFPGSPRVDVGLVPMALQALPFAAGVDGRKIAHFLVGLSPRAEAPIGGSGHLPLIAAALLCWQATLAHQKLVRPGATSQKGPWRVITGSGLMNVVPMARTEGLAPYAFQPVAGWKEKIQALAQLLATEPVASITLAVPLSQVQDVATCLTEGLPDFVRSNAETWERADGVRLHLHGVSLPADVESLIKDILFPQGGTQDPLTLLLQAHAQRSEWARQGKDTALLDKEINRRIRQLRATSTLEPGDYLGRGRFELLEVAGRGGFATVWKAQDRMENRTVAIKVLHRPWSDDPNYRGIFFRSAQQMARLRHPGIVTVLLERGVDEPHVFLVMEYLSGGTLTNTQQDRSLFLLLEIADAMAYAHQEGVIHRDLKPENVLLDGEGQIRLVDFDLTGVLNPLQSGTSTTTARTFLYAAPETFSGAAGGAAADVYALGLLGIFLLRRGALQWDVIRDPEPIIARLETSESIKTVLAHAVRREPSRRYEHAGAFAEALRRAQISREVRFFAPKPREDSVGSGRCSQSLPDWRSLRPALASGIGKPRICGLRCWRWNSWSRRRTHGRSGSRQWRSPRCGPPTRWPGRTGWQRRWWTKNSGNG